MKNNKKYFPAIILILLTGATILFAQVYDSVPCKKGYALLKQDILKNKLNALLQPEIIGGAYDNWSSSFLAPAGSPPVKPAQKNCFDNPDCFEPYMIAYDNWSCMYCAKRAWDGDTKTAWVGGVSGDGIGEIVIAVIDVEKPAEIWAGYGKSDSLFKANNRPHSIKVYTLYSTDANAPQVGTVFLNIRVAATIEASLKDFNGYQPLPLPKYSPGQYNGGKPVSQNFVAIEILTVYRGTKYRDTCITEIRNKP